MRGLPSSISTTLLLNLSLGGLAAAELEKHDAIPTLDEPSFSRLTHACGSFTSCRPDEVRPEEQRAARPAMERADGYAELYLLSPNSVTQRLQRRIAC